MKYTVNLTLDQFKADVQVAIDSRQDCIRKGQAVANYISTKYPEVNKALTGSYHDCFYNDDLIDDYVIASWGVINSVYNNLQGNLDLETKTLEYYINHQEEPAWHEWGDSWRYWDTLYQAIKEMGEYIRKSHLLIYDKEKYGTYRFDVLSMYDGTLKSWLQPSCRRDFDWYFHSSLVYSDFPRIYKFIRNTISPVVNWFLKGVSRIDRMIAHPHLPFYHEYVDQDTIDAGKAPVCYKIDNWIRKNIRFIPKRFIRKVQAWQMQKINEGFQKIALKYPQIVHEFISDVDCWEWIRPYDNYILDGKVIHDMHWQPLKSNTKSSDE